MPAALIQRFIQPLQTWRMNRRLEKIVRKHAFIPGGASPNGVPQHDLDLAEHAMAHGADAHLRTAMLERVIFAPMLAMRLIMRGAVPGPGLLDLLKFDLLHNGFRISPILGSGCAARWRNENDWFREVVLECARCAPHLDWYQMVGLNANRQPLAMAIEIRLPGFNEALEKAQALQDLPVGPVITEAKLASIGIGDLLAPYPRLQWVEGRGRNAILADLLKAGGNPNINISYAGEQRSAIAMSLLYGKEGMFESLLAYGARTDEEGMRAIGRMLWDEILGYQRSPYGTIHDSGWRNINMGQIHESLIALAKERNANWDVDLHVRNDRGNSVTMAQCAEMLFPGLLVQVQHHGLVRETPAAKAPTRRAARL